MTPIKDFEQLYCIDENGNVWSFKSNKFLTQQKNEGGYYYVTLYKEGKSYHKYVHRLVAETFIPNLDNLLQVNHKDENKNNNNINNLEWISAKDNANYGTRTKRQSETQQQSSPCNKQIAMCDKKTHQIIQIFYSISEASRQTGITLSNISKVANGDRQSAGGYFWKFI